MSQGAGRSLKVKCPTWDHVETFYERKLRGGNVLAMRVPFQAEKGAPLTLALELPSELVMAIDGTIDAVKVPPDGGKVAVRIVLHGFTAEVRQRLMTLVADARGEEVGEFEAIDETRAVPRPRLGGGPPAPVPVDAPVDELVEAPHQLGVDDVEKGERDAYAALDSELRRLREAAAHEVLGVGWDAQVADIRAGYFELTKRFHPDVYARYRSRAILHLAQEVFIHINKAYDRMRDAAVQAGNAIAAGPALLPHVGWLAGFEDLGPEIETQAAPVPESAQVRFSASAVADVAAVTFSSPARAPAPPAPASPAPPAPGSPAPPAPPTPAPAVKEVPVTADGLFGDMQLDESRPDNLLDEEPAEEASDEAALDEARSLIGAGDHEGAREAIAGALLAAPRNRRLRALYHVATGKVHEAAGNTVEAVSQFETALAHDPECTEARAALPGDGKQPHKRGLFGRLFK